VVPARRVEHRPFKLAEARDGRDRRLGQGAVTEREHVGGEAAPRRGDAPPPLALIPQRVDHLMAEAEVRQETEAHGAAAQVVPDLGLGREGAAPVGVGREGERVQVGRHVAGGARVRVVAPRPADVVGALEHDEVVDPALFQPDRQSQTRKTRADDGHAHVRNGPRRSGRRGSDSGILSGANGHGGHSGAPITAREHARREGTARVPLLIVEAIDQVVPHETVVMRQSLWGVL